ncbi:hypothetical protein DFH27DRAFT_521463 [Peziza echinospora]|nr:hypothetical protein DFH27DRAFT_521463 [Peziza echinospora]
MNMCRQYPYKVLFCFSSEDSEIHAASSWRLISSTKSRAYQCFENIGLESECDLFEEKVRFMLKVELLQEWYCGALLRFCSPKKEVSPHLPPIPTVLDFSQPRYNCSASSKLGELYGSLYTVTKKGGFFLKKHLSPELDWLRKTIPQALLCSAIINEISRELVIPPTRGTISWLAYCVPLPSHHQSGSHSSKEVQELAQNMISLREEENMEMEMLKLTIPSVTRPIHALELNSSISGLFE